MEKPLPIDTRTLISEWSGPNPVRHAEDKH
jgi:hypothetical protein